MPAPRKTRPLLLADGSTFRIGPRTVSVDVSDFLTDPPALWLHINPTGGVLELPPAPDGTPQLPVSIRPDAVAALVVQINRVRRENVQFGGTPELVKLPPTLARLAKHASAWAIPRQPVLRAGLVSGYPGKTPDTNEPQVLFVNRETGECELCALRTGEPPQASSPGGLYSYEYPAKDRRTVSRREAVAWMVANGYSAIPAVLVAPPRKPGVANETPPASG